MSESDSTADAPEYSQMFLDSQFPLCATITSHLDTLQNHYVKMTFPIYKTFCTMVLNTGKITAFLAVTAFNCSFFCCVTLQLFAIFSVSFISGVRL